MSQVSHHLLSVDEEPNVSTVLVKDENGRKWSKTVLQYRKNESGRFGIFLHFSN
jgi:hypothetical protein